MLESNPLNPVSVTVALAVLTVVLCVLDALGKRLAAVTGSEPLKSRNRLRNWLADISLLRITVVNALFGMAVVVSGEGATERWSGVATVVVCIACAGWVVRSGRHRPSGCGCPGSARSGAPFRLALPPARCERRAGWPRRSRRTSPAGPTTPSGRHMFCTRPRRN